MLVRAQAAAESSQAEGGKACAAPTGDAIAPLSFTRPHNRHAGFCTNRIRVASRRGRLSGNACALGGICIWSAHDKPAVTLPANPAYDRGWQVRPRSNPNGNGLLDGQRIDARPIHRVEPAFEADFILRPKLPRQLELLVTACSARCEVLTLKEVFILQAANADSNPNPSVRQPVELCRLLRKKRRLACRQNDDRRHKLIPHLSGTTETAPHDVLYWRSWGQMAVRQGDWKLVSYVAKMDEGEIMRGEPRDVMTPHRLYNLRDDIGEARDLAKQEPKRVARMLALWNRWNAEMPPAAE